MLRHFKNFSSPLESLFSILLRHFKNFPSPLESLFPILSNILQSSPHSTSLHVHSKSSRVGIESFDSKVNQVPVTVTLVKSNLMACRQKRISRFTISKSLDILLVLGFHVDATPDLGKLRSWQIKSCALGKSNLNSAAVSSFFTSNTLRSTAVAHNSETKRRCSFSAHCTLYIAHNSGTKRH